METESVLFNELWAILDVIDEMKKRIELSDFNKSALIGITFRAVSADVNTYKYQIKAYFYNSFDQPNNDFSDLIVDGQATINYKDGKDNDISKKINIIYEEKSYSLLNKLSNLIFNDYKPMPAKIPPFFEDIFPDVIILDKKGKLENINIKRYTHFIKRFPGFQKGVNKIFDESRSLHINKLAEDFYNSDRKDDLVNKKVFELK